MATYRTRGAGVLRKVPPVMMMLSFVVAAAVSTPSQESHPPSITEILKKAAAYCQLFESASLNYVCIEDLRETIYMPYLIPGPPTGNVQSLRHHFVYDYQLIRAGGKTDEKRKLLEENGIRQNAEAAPFKVSRFIYRHIILGPLILGEDWQRYHDYKITGRGKVGKEECTILEAVPKPFAPRGHLFGKVWIREQDGRIMKLEWYQESIQNFGTFVATGVALGAKPQIELIMEYLMEKNGIGFPSRCRMSEDYITDATGLRLTRSETTVTYQDYKFFTVETEVRTQH